MPTAGAGDGRWARQLSGRRLGRRRRAVPPAARDGYSRGRRTGGARRPRGTSALATKRGEKHRRRLAAAAERRATSVDTRRHRERRDGATRARDGGRPLHAAAAATAVAGPRATARQRAPAAFHAGPLPSVRAQGADPPHPAGGAAAAAAFAAAAPLAHAAAATPRWSGGCVPRRTRRRGGGASKRARGSVLGKRGKIRVDRHRGRRRGTDGRRDGIERVARRRWPRWEARRPAGGSSNDRWPVAMHGHGAKPSVK